MPKCENCGYEYKEGDLFCENCGQKLKEKPKVKEIGEEPKKPEAVVIEKEDRKVGKWIVIALLVIGVGSLIPLFDKQIQYQQEIPYQDWERAKYFDQTVKVSPGSYRDIEMSLSPGTGIIGSFKADSDLNIYIFGDTDFYKWKAKSPFEVYYQAIKATSGSFEVTTPKEDVYHLVLDNGFSILTYKNVNLKIDTARQVTKYRYETRYKTKKVSLIELLTG